MNWKTKGIIQGALSILPGGNQCNYFLQQTVGQLRSDEFIHKVFLADITVLFERIARFGLDPLDSRILEIGTGWFPVFPVCLALAGFRDIVTVDLHSHLRKSGIRRTLLALEPHLKHPCFLSFAGYEAIRERYESFLEADFKLGEMGITYLAPCNAASMDYSAESFDLIASNNVFEHVPSPVLLDLLAEGKRLLRPNGHIIHCVNCGDHYAYSDSSISQVNYLQFSEAQWARWNNSIHYQNRLRPIDFIEMADETHFKVESAEFVANPAYLKQIENMAIAKEFQHYSPAQLAATSLTLIASV